jgi:transposase
MRACFQSLTDPQWQILEEIIDSKRKRVHCLRTIFDAIVWINQTGCQWRNMESSFPPWQTVYYYFRKWQQEGFWEQCLDNLNAYTRRQEGRFETPSVLALDSQSVKKTTFIHIETGVDGGKNINGRKRHIAVDTLGLPWAIAVTSAQTSDNEGGKQLIDQLAGKVPRVELLAVDNGYKVAFEEYANKKGYRVEIAQRPPSKERGFVPEKNRWMVERTFAWLNFRRRLSKEYERTVESAKAMLEIAFISLLINRI